MLPEVLSNGICSLQQGQRRRVKSVYITYDRNGTVLGREFANSTICSTARLTYTDTDDILRGKTGDFDGRVVALVKDMETLARAIEKRRTKNGMLHLDLPEIELIYNKSGMVVDAEPAENSYPHTVIEMFMVEANEAVAAMLDRFNVPFMRRVHPAPDQLSIKDAGKSIKLCGLKVPKKLDRAAIIDLLAAAKGTSNSYAINMHILRSLARAEYGPQHIGHFALASKHYCHFTSPIRRYADLMVHRLVECYLEQRLNMIGLEEVLPAGELTEIGKEITFTEQRAESAERELKTVLVLQMLNKRIGDELNCVVSGLTNFGLFVQCLKFGIEGMIELSDLGSDQWRFNQRAQAIVGRYSGKSVHLGQEMKVRIASVNVAARHLNVVPVEPLVATRSELIKPVDSKKGKGKYKKSKGRRLARNKR
jgi:ribonuclease R